jgi:glycosyltransferase involved in cell wall biosynthesis
VRICIIGKFPPIQGGVSMRTYRAAQALAGCGHEVHVVTNAKEVQPPFRMHMRAQDWARCEARYDGGSVTVHWTDPVDRSQAYIPMASPFVSKLAAIAAGVHAGKPFDVIYSHYLEPYGVAAYLAAQMTGVPHVARMAGSDAGRLWRHPQFEALYDHVLRSAELVIAGGKVAERAVARGVDPKRIVLGGRFVIPDDLFTPEGPRLDFATLRAELESDPAVGDALWGEFTGDLPYFGICGKLGERKGSFALLDAMHRLKRGGLEVGLAALAHGSPAVEKDFRARARQLDLADRILQIPFLPHWRVPEFLRGCLAVCCLEQDFPIGFHSPIIPFEVLLCGTCLVGATEVIRKLPMYGRLVHGYGCVAVEDVNDTAELSAKLAAIVRDPKPVAVVGARGRRFARELQREVGFPGTLERTLAAAASRQRPPSLARGSVEEVGSEPMDDRFPLTRLAEVAIGKAAPGAAAVPSADIARTRDVLAALERAIGEGRASLATLAAGVRIELAIAEAESETATRSPADVPDPLFRLRARRWAMDECDLAELVPLPNPRLRVLEFDYDIAQFLGARTVAQLPTALTHRQSYLVAFGCSRDRPPDPLFIDSLTARILKLSDGTRTVAEVAQQLESSGEPSPDDDHLKWIENLFVCGLIHLEDSRIGARGSSTLAERRTAGA